MTEYKFDKADRLIANPESGPRIVLFYGPDPGGVTERAAMMTERLVGKDAFAVTRLDADETGSEPGRLADEVFAGSLFAGRRVVRLRTGTRSVAPAVQPILDAPPSDTWLIIEAGDLRKGSPLRALCERATTAAAIPCYADNDAALGRMIDDEVRSAGLTIAPEARQMLVPLLGADRAASRAEIRKLCLYAASGGTIGVADISAVIGDGAAVAVDDAVEAALLGDVAAVDRGMRRLLSAATAPSTVATAAERQIIQLHRLRAAIDRGSTASAVLQAMRPPPFPARRQVLEQQLRRWPRPMLDWALQRIGDASRDARLYPATGAAIVSEALIAIALRPGRRQSAA
ncbi:MAG: DNA polymerase III subunit delta [Bauldia sp.]|nr:DNA polymerase III subunit delta [Bauldia sp.]